MLYGATSKGRDLAPSVASALGCGLTADCTDLQIGDFKPQRGRKTYTNVLLQIRPTLGGSVIATVVNLFIGSYGLHMIISYLGVFIFIGLTAYDTQKLKHMALSQPADIDAEVTRKGAILGALTLYLDFILMFQFLLSIMGGSRD